MIALTTNKPSLMFVSSNRARKYIMKYDNLRFIIFSVLVIASQKLMTLNFSQFMTQKISTELVHQAIHTVHSQFTNAARIKLTHLKIFSKQIRIPIVLAALRLSTSTAFLIALETIKKNEWEKEFIKKRRLIPCTDLDILNTFNTVKTDMGITEGIRLFTLNSQSSMGEYIAAPYSISQENLSTVGIALNIEKIGGNNPLLIHVIAHELGHYLQQTHARGAYKTKSISRSWFRNASPEEIGDENIMQEIGADATSAGYQDCKYCLRIVSCRNGISKKAYQDLGYFSKLDYKPYINRAVEEDWICPAHDHMRKMSVLEKVKKIVGLHGNPCKPQDFLPKTYDRSSYKTLETHTEPTKYEPQDHLFGEQ